MINNQHLSLTDTIVQGKGNIVSDMGGEKVMLSVTNGKYYNLGEMGGAIWELIESPVVITELIETLTNHYQVEESVCRQEVISFLEELLKEGLINIR